MGFFSALKEWGDSMNDFYANPRMTLHRPSCAELESKLKRIIEWLEQNSEVIDLGNPTFSSFRTNLDQMLENRIAGKYGRKKYTMPKHKVEEFQSLCNSFVEVAKVTKTEIELIPVRAAGMPHVIGDSAIYRDIAADLGSKYFELVKRFELITKNVYVRG